MWETSTLRTLANEDLGTLVEYDPLTSRDTVYATVERRPLRQASTETVLGSV